MNACLQEERGCCLPMPPKLKEFALGVFWDKDASEFTFFSMELCKKGKPLGGKIGQGDIGDKRECRTLRAALREARHALSTPDVFSGPGGGP